MRYAHEASGCQGNRQVICFHLIVAMRREERKAELQGNDLIKDSAAVILTAWFLSYSRPASLVDLRQATRKKRRAISHHISRYSAGEEFIINSLTIFSQSSWRPLTFCMGSGRLNAYFSSDTIFSLPASMASPMPLSQDA
jgi:hypothetical protein